MLSQPVAPAQQGEMPGKLTKTHRDLLALCALRVADKSVDWSLLARTCESPEGVEAALEGDIREQSQAARVSLPLLRTALAHIAEARERVAVELEAAELAGARIVTVLDDAYPVNLRQVPDRPPFLFYLGDLSDADSRSLAVIGTRGATELGISRAKRMATGLVEAGIVVYSGLALGIDSAAHVATLDAGGRTVAVLGHGIASKVYPAANDVLAKRIIHQGGAVLSQFWPLARPAKWTFPRRNVVTSGSALGSIVIECEHGKLVFLVRSLVMHESWAAKMVADGRAIEVATLDDVLKQLDSPPTPPTQTEQTYRQLTLGDL
jgi:DNA processing protein